MKKITRIIILIISLALIVSYFVPMWYIDLDAPQYPEGLGMKIWLSKMSGDLNTINGLNHYIGMKKIYPDAIPELKIMPYLIGILIAGGFVGFITGKKWMFISWASFFVIIGIVGLVDFYSWEYDYGHNLDPHAAIKVPGMNYQPPVLGTKQLLNFTAYSYPDIGGVIIMGSALVALLFMILELKKVKVEKIEEKEKSPKKIFSSIAHKSIAIFLFSVFLVSCSMEAQPIAYGKEQCTFCKMTISDPRFGCEYLTKKGKVFKFDANECMINYISQNHVKEESIYSLLISDYSSPGKFMDAQNAFFIIDDSIKSPMGANLAAFSEKNMADKYGKKTLKWDEAFQKVSLKN